MMMEPLSTPLLENRGEMSQSKEPNQALSWPRYATDALGAAKSPGLITKYRVLGRPRILADKGGGTVMQLFERVIPDLLTDDPRVAASFKPLKAPFGTDFA